MTAFLDPSSNFHPYECDGPGRCEHCDRLVGPDHDPETCELCEPLEEQRTPARRGAESREAEIAYEKWLESLKDHGP